MLRLNAVHLAVCLLPLALAGCGEPADHDDPRIRPPLVRVATVERAEAGSRAFTGVVVARTQSDLGFRVAGKVLERRVETGQSVKRGQLLLRLDPADLALQAQSQQRAVDAARARAKKATNDLARYRGLVASGAISAAEFDQINAAAEAARADLSAAQAQANVAQNATGYAGLLADADGVVVETLAEPGQVVSAWRGRGSAKRGCNCRRRCARRSAARRWRHAMAANLSRSRRPCACFRTRLTPPPAPLKRAMCLTARWRMPRWGLP